MQKNSTEFHTTKLKVELHISNCLEWEWIYTNKTQYVWWLQVVPIWITRNTVRKLWKELSHPNYRYEMQSGKANQITFYLLLPIYLNAWSTKFDFRGKCGAHSSIGCLTATAITRRCINPSGKYQLKDEVYEQHVDVFFILRI
jgi:hypothetical protein